MFNKLLDLSKYLRYNYNMRNIFFDISKYKIIYMSLLQIYMIQSVIMLKSNMNSPNNEKCNLLI